MRTKFTYVGRGVLNLAVVLAVIFGLQSLIRGRVSDTLGLIAVCTALVASYVAGVRWIERRQPSELLAGTGLTEFAAGLALGLALFTTLILLLWMFGVYRPSGWGTLVGVACGDTRGDCLQGFPFPLEREATRHVGRPGPHLGVIRCGALLQPWGQRRQLRRHRTRSWCPAGCGLCLDAALVAAHRTASGLELRGRLHLRNVGLGWENGGFVDCRHCPWPRAAHRRRVRTRGFHRCSGNLPGGRPIPALENGPPGEA
jgi:hypothetical protein